MDQNLKERLVGAAVLIMLAVIFIPMFLSDVPITDDRITESNIPEKPEAFNSRIVPLQAVPQEISTESNGQTDSDPHGMVPDSDPAAGGPQQESDAGTDEDGTETGVQIKEVIKDSAGVGLTAWVIQVGSFASEENAQSLNRQLREKHYPAFVEPLVRGDKVIYRVRVGPELRRSNAENLRQEIKKKLGYDGILVRYP